MEGTVGLVESGTLTQVSVEGKLVSELRTRDVHVLATNNDDLLAVQDLLGHNGSQTTQKVALGVDNNNRFKGRHGSVNHDTGVKILYAWDERARREGAG